MFKGITPCRGALRPSGYSPLVKMGIVLSQSLTLAIGMVCRMFRPVKYLWNTTLTSAQSMALDCDRKRLSRSAFSEACMRTVKPRSLVARSAIAGIAETGGPACCSTTSLIFCAQMAGNPAMAPDPAATPAACNRVRRPSCAGRAADLRVILAPVVWARVTPIAWAQAGAYPGNAASHKPELRFIKAIRDHTVYLLLCCLHDVPKYCLYSRHYRPRKAAPRSAVRGDEIVAK